MKDSGKVNIHGKEYETVASRVQRFREKHSDKYGIITDVVSRTDDMVVVKAMIVRYGEVLRDENGTYTDQAVIATGYAEESRTSSSINRTSALENAETSAIGRALANFGLAGTEYASADEVAQAIAQRPASRPSGQPAERQPATENQKKAIYALLSHRQVNKADMPGVLETDFGVSDGHNLTKLEAIRVIDRLKGAA